MKGEKGEPGPKCRKLTWSKVKWNSGKKWRSRHNSLRNHKTADILWRHHWFPREISIERGDQWWRREMCAVFLGYRHKRLPTPYPPPPPCGELLFRINIPLINLLSTRQQRFLEPSVLKTMNKIRAMLLQCQKLLTENIQVRIVLYIFVELHTLLP